MIERSKQFDEDLISNLPRLNSWCIARYGKKFSEDITQDVCLVALKHGSFDYSSNTSMLTWLCEIAKFLYLKNYRYNTIHPLLIEDIIEENFDMEVVYQTNNVDVKDICKCINKLCDNQKQIIKLTILGYKIREISVMFNLKQTSTKSRLWIARNNLKKMLK